MDAAPADRTSAVLAGLAARMAAAPRVAFRDIVGALGDRAFGVLLALLAVPNMLPVNYIPGLALAFAVPLALIGLQLAFGLDRPRFPGFVERRTIAGAQFQGVVARIVPVLERAERHVRPRWSALVSAPAERAMGLAGIFLALVLSLPIPFGNFLPAFGLLAFGLALVEKDGRMAALGFAVSAACLAALAALAAFGGEILRAALAWFGL
jgi:hypothetical protein